MVCVDKILGKVLLLHQLIIMILTNHQVLLNYNTSYTGTHPDKLRSHSEHQILLNTLHVHVTVQYGHVSFFYHFSVYIWCSD